MIIVLDIDTIIKQMNETLDINYGMVNFPDINDVNISHVKNLSISNTNLSDLSFLKQLTGCKKLILVNNNINDLSYFTYLNSLVHLVVTDNNITDISPLASLNKLKYLDLRNNNIESLVPLSDIPSLKKVFFRDNDIKAGFIFTNRHSTKNTLKKLLYEYYKSKYISYYCYLTLQALINNGDSKNTAYTFLNDHPLFALFLGDLFTKSELEEFFVNKLENDNNIKKHYLKELLKHNCLTSIGLCEFANDFDYITDLNLSIKTKKLLFEIKFKSE